MATEHKCVVCETWFEPKMVDHSSPFWRGWSRKNYCGVECVGRAECNWRTSYADHIQKDDLFARDDEENQDEAALDTYEK